MKIKSSISIVFSVIVFFSCNSNNSQKKIEGEHQIADSLMNDVKSETKRTWDAYLTYAWPHDALFPISKTHYDWYKEPLNMSPLDAYSTLLLMGFQNDAKRIENFVTDSLTFNKDIFVKVFEVDIRILGGLLYIYEATGNKKVLQKAQEFGDKLLPAFNSPTGLPYYYVNLKTGTPKGNIVNVAEAGSYIFEFGILSYYTENPKYYQAAKRATKKVFSLRSKLDLLGRDINVESGEWTIAQSMVGAYADSYFEYLYKTWLLFKDPEIKKMWDIQITAIQKHIAEPKADKLWYGKVDMNTGVKVNAEVTLWDAYFPALLALSGDMKNAGMAQNAWNFLWNKYGLIPMVYDYDKDSIVNPYFQLNPEVIESAYYLWHYTGDSAYFHMVEKYYCDIKKYCRTEIAYCHVKDVRTMEKHDEMETFFIAETMKYCYLTFNAHAQINPDDFVFNTEAHPFKKSNFDKEIAKKRLGF